MKATEQYFPVVLFFMLCKVILTFESVDEILKCDHSNESYWALLSCGAIYYAVLRISIYESESVLRISIYELDNPHGQEGKFLNKLCCRSVEEWKRAVDVIILNRCGNLATVKDSRASCMDILIIHLVGQNTWYCKHVRRFPSFLSTTVNLASSCCPLTNPFWTSFFLPEATVPWHFYVKTKLLGIFLICIYEVFHAWPSDSGQSCLKRSWRCHQFSCLPPREEVLTELKKMIKKGSETLSDGMPASCQLSLTV